MKASKVLVVLVLLVALVMAYGHAPLALGLSSLFRPQGQPPPRPPPSGQAVGGPTVPFFAIGTYFLLATIIYVVGGLFVVAGKFFKLANLGLVVLAIVDNLLLIYTRTMPNIFFRREIPWSWGWFPLGTVQVLVGQVVITLLCVYLFYGSRASKISSP